jgi:hypothetical protein
MTHKITRETIVRVAIPMSLYESVKGKVLNEGYEVFYTNKNVRSKKNFSDNVKAMSFAKQQIESGASEVDVFKTGSGFHSTAQEEYLVGWYGNNSYWSNKAKKDPNLMKKKLGEQEEMNEAKKPSAGLTKKEKSAVAKKAKAGKDIGEKGKGFEKVAKKAAKKYGSKEKGQKVAAAAMWKAQAAKKK